MAYCIYCGAELMEGSKFCIRCGRPVAMETKSAQVPDFLAPDVAGEMELGFIEAIEDENN